jgi:hypothetical protein
MVVWLFAGGGESEAEGLVLLPFMSKWVIEYNEFRNKRMVRGQFVYF